MSKTRRLAWLSVFLLVLLVTLSTVVLAKEPVTIRVLSFWSESRFPTWKSSIEEFHETHPHIRVEFEMAGGAGASQRMQMEMLSDNPPDVIQFWKYMFNDYAENGQLVELTPYLEEKGWLSGYFYEPVLEWNSPSFDGKIWGLSDFLGPSVFFYNVSMFKDYGLTPPDTFDELLELGKKFNGRGVLPLLGDWQATTNILDPLAKIQVQTAGMKPVHDAVLGKTTLLSEPLIRAVKMMKQMIDVELIQPGSLSFDSVMAASALVSGQAAMYSDKSHVINNIDPIKPPGFEYDIFTMRFVDDPVTMYSATLGADWAIPLKTRHPDEAWEFMEWMWSKEWQRKHLVEAGQLSSIPSANAAIDHPISRKVADTILPTLNTDSFYLIDLLPSPVLAEVGARLHELVLGRINDPVQVLEYGQAALEKWQAEQRK